MPTAEANSQICAILGDLSAGAFLAQRKGLAIQKSEHAFFANNQLGIRGIQRVDFSVYGVGDTTTPGPIVGLITAAS
jgi:HK97 family phage major capsid protein